MAETVTLENTIDHWKHKREGDTPPYRYNLGKPERDIQFILTPNEFGDVKIKRAGMFFERLFCGLLQGRNFASLFIGKELEQIDIAIKRVFDEPAIANIYFEINDEFHHIALLPVRSDHGPIESALGVIDLKELPQNSAPLAYFKSCEVESLRIERKELKYGFAEPKNGFQHKKPKFKVIDGDAKKTSHSKRLDLKVVKNIKREP